MCSCAGGLGLAAIQIAHAAGAVPVATAGSLAKRSYLRQHHGLAEVASSRSTDFIDEIGLAGRRSAPHVVLNSLTSPGVWHALCILKSASTHPVT